MLVFSVFERFNPLYYIKEISRTRNIFTYNLVDERAEKAVSTKALKHFRTHPTPLRPRVKQRSTSSHHSMKYTLSLKLLPKKLQNSSFSCADQLPVP